MWHNFVKDADSWIQIDMPVKFGLKISNRLGENVRKP